MSYKIQGKEFEIKKRITNRMLIEMQEIEEDGGTWYLVEKSLNKTMRIILEGPHDEIDWLDEETTKCLEIYRDFFTQFKKKTSELIDGFSSPSQASS
jgi:hypothetical protein